MTTRPTWFITGCSTGLGRELAKAALHRDLNVVVTARNPDAVADIVAAHPDRAVAAALDVTDPAQIDAALAVARERFGAIDVLVNNAGYVYRAAVEEGEREAVEALFATNFFGAVELIKAVLPDMRRRRSGAIVNLASMSSRITPPGSGYYAATKAALEALTGSLRKEAGPLGITVMVVAPGAVRTEFFRGVAQSEVPIDDYAATSGARRADHTRYGTQLGDPAKGAAAILEAVLSPEPPAVLVLGTDALEMTRTTIAAHLDEVAAWEALSASTDFADGA